MAFAFMYPTTPYTTIIIKTPDEGISFGRMVYNLTIQDVRMAF